MAVIVSPSNVVASTYGPIRTAASVTDRAVWNASTNSGPPVGTASSGSSGIRYSRSLYPVTTNCAGLTADFTLAYGYETNIFQTDGATQFTDVLTGSWEVLPVGVAPRAAVGTLYQMTFNGATSVTRTARGIYTCDPLPADLIKGQNLYVRVASTSAANAMMPLGRSIVPELWEYSGTGTDLTMSTADTPLLGGAGTSMGPVRISGRVSGRVPVIGVASASVGMGFGDQQDPNTPGAGRAAWGYNRRWLSRITGNYGYVQLSRSSEGIYQVVNGGNFNNYRTRTRLADRLDYLIEAYGSTDVSSAGANRTSAQISADKILFWRNMANQGVKVVSSTIPPVHVTTTDGYSTLANQTADTNNAARADYNTWLLSGAPILISGGVATRTTAGTAGSIRVGEVGHPLWKIIDVAGYVEAGGTGSLTGKYRVDVPATYTGPSAGTYYGTTDGDHPSSKMHEIVAAGLPDPNLWFV